ncbi:MAG: hypothetical protein ACRDHN_17325 [Thermomicrobiales bacterium]
MQQRQVRYYITQDEDQAIVRSVPISRRAQSVMAPEERISAQTEETQTAEPERTTVAERVRSAVRRGGSAGRR